VRGPVAKRPAASFVAFAILASLFASPRSGLGRTAASATAASTVARAAPRAAPSATPTVVLLAPRDHPANTGSLVQAVRGQLSDVAVRLRRVAVARLPATRAGQLRLARAQLRRAGVGAVCWYDPGTGKAHVLLRRGAVLRLVSRGVGRAGAQGHYDAAAIVIRTAIRAHLGGETRGVRVADGARKRIDGAAPARQPPDLTGPRADGPLADRPADRPADHPADGEPVAPAAREPPRRVGLGLALWYAVSVYAPREVPVAQGPRLDVLLRLRRRWGVYLAYRFDPALRARGEQATLALSRHLLELGLRLGFRLGRWELGARLGFDVTAITRRITAAAPGVTAVEGGPDWLGGLSPLVFVGVRVHRRVEIRLALGVRIRLRAERYVTHDGHTLLAPWGVQPTGMLGIGVDLY
jgi:hypothetical protein